MRKYRYLERDLGNICRECLNKKYGLRLRPKNCIYENYPHMCHECREVKNIVCEIRFIKRIVL